MEPKASMGHQGNGTPEEVEMGSWNPAFRPEDSDYEHAKTKSLPKPSTPQPTSSGPQQRSHYDRPLPPVDSTSALTALTHGDQPTYDGQTNATPTASTQPSNPEPQAVTEWPETEQSSSGFFDNLLIRTNSFPDMDSNQDECQLQGSGADTPTDKGKVEEMDMVQEPAGEQTDGPFQDTGDSTTWKPTSVTSDEDDGYSFFDQVNVQTKPIYNPPEAESRFEEGVPLVNNTEVSSPAETKGRASLDELFQQDTTTEEAGFFSSNVEGETSAPQVPEPPAFNRKSTSQVLESLKFEDGPNVVDSPAEDLTANMTLQAAEPANANGHNAGDDIPADDMEARWKAMLGDDDLLMDDELLPESTEAPQDQAAGDVVSPISHENSHQIAPQTAPFQYAPPGAPSTFQQNNAAFGASRTNIYTPHQPSSSDLLAGLPPPPRAQPAQSSNNATEKPVSFVTQSKAGYQSPYDLPEDIRPKRAPVYRAPTTQSPAASSMPPPPPRSSSISGVRPPSSSGVIPPPMSHAAPGIAPAPQSSATPATGTSNFFEELPATSRSRPSTRGRYTPQSQVPQSAATAPASAPNSYFPPQQPTSTFSPPQLQQAERVGPYASLPGPAAPPAPTQTSRYSPKPPSSDAGPRPPSARYSPMPPPQTSPPNKYMAPPSILPFQPRTSSPLAQHETHPPPGPLQTGADGAHSTFQAPVHPPQPQIGGEAAGPVPPPGKRLGSPPVNRYMPQQQGGVSTYVPPPAPNSQMQPPKRSMTQSPSKRVYSLNQPPMAAHEPVIPRPASVHGTGPSTSGNAFPAAKPPVAPKGPQLEFISPTDGQELDPLERWKGAPIFRFGFGGTVLSTFPHHVPRYTTGQIVPKLKPSPGEVKTRQFEDVVPPPAPVSKFPGPLRSKSKKKDVISWLSAMISSFEEEQKSKGPYLDQASQHRLEEKILLWKVVMELVNHDGALEGTPEIEKSVRDTLSPAPQSDGSDKQPAPLQADGLGAFSSAAVTVQSEPTNAVGLERIRTNLLAGDREKAVWEAVDSRLWGHAMLLSSTLDKSVWKQVAQEFIRREVRSVGENNESLAAFYEVLAGNAEESVDELVPVSARAGLQFVSKNTGAGPSKNAFDGLNKWKETVTFILSNRGPHDHQALLALSRLLGSYGRVEAAHICALFAKTATSSIIGGMLEPHAAIVLLGADHHHYPSTFMKDKNSWLLTEVYEYAVSVLAGSPSAVLPHVQAFKLQHARVLAEEGHKTEAQEYCDSIGAILRSNPKPSPYYHQIFCNELDELSARLRQAPGESSSWISRPSMEKVSGSIWTKFNQFVTGDDSDAGSTGSGKGAEADVGPFAKMVGTPPISRSPSVAESYFIPAHQHPATASSSTLRYAPGNQTASPEQNRGRRSLDSQRSPSYGTLGYYPQRRQSQDPVPPHDGASQMSSSPMYGSPMAHAPIHTHSPLAPVEEVYSSGLSVADDAAASSNAANPYQPTPPPEQQVMPQPSYGQATGGYTPPTQGGYEPPTGTTSYEPPSYEPPSYEPEGPESDNAEEKPKKKSFMDDEDDDMMARAEQVKQAERERRNKEAAEAVRKAAEDDGTYMILVHIASVPES